MRGVQITHHAEFFIKSRITQGGNHVLRKKKTLYVHRQFYFLDPKSVFMKRILRINKPKNCIGEYPNRSSENDNYWPKQK